jgi:hypothetical protein
MTDDRDVLAAIGRVRRQMPRNSDVMLICDVATTSVTSSPSVVATPSSVVATPAPSPPPVVATCPECAKRRVAKAEAQARFRAKARDGVVAPGACGNGASA